MVQFVHYILMSFWLVPLQLPGTGRLQVSQTLRK